MNLRPVVLLSKCIEHEACRYDGSMIGDSFVKKIKDYVDFVLVCPEREIGLPVPREAIRIIKTDDTEALVFSKSGNDITIDMIDFSNTFIDSLIESERTIHGAILKGRSPSCGIKDVKVYMGIGKSHPAPRKSVGLFANTVKNKFDNLAIEDEGRLSNYNIRDHFLTRIYTLALFDKVLLDRKMESLIKFHTDNKYLLMAYHQSNQKLLGKIVANHEGHDVDIVLCQYLRVLKKVFATPLKRGKNINMLMHILGYFKNELSKEEKSYFLDLLEQYSDKKIPLSVPLTLLYSWVIRFNENYLKTQTIFKPYPNEILDVTDSGKGIK